MTEFINLPVETISNVAEFLPQDDVISLYSTCRHLRNILVISIRRELSITSQDSILFELIKLATENPYFGRSFSVVRLRSRDPSLQQHKSKKAAAQFYQKVVKTLQTKHVALHKVIYLTFLFTFSVMALIWTNVNRTSKTCYYAEMEHRIR
jgi:hypothetical protein